MTVGILAVHSGFTRNEFVLNIAENSLKFYIDYYTSRWCINLKRTPDFKLVLPDHIGTEI